MSSQPVHVTCPSCGGPSKLTSYSPEPALCETCQRVLGVGPEPAAARDEPSPDNPVWGMPSAVGMILVFVASLIASGALAGLAYLIYTTWQGLPYPFETALNPGAIHPGIAFMGIVLSGIAHLVTLVVAWVVVTNGGRQKFFESLGWGWSDRIRLPHVIGIAILLQIFAIVLGQFVEAPESIPLEQLLRSSPAVRGAVAVIAVLTAPLVEEIVFRGVLYPALARPCGRVAAIVIVSLIFLLIHAEQYASALGIMIPLGVLSVTLTALRAYTGSLLPSFALHVLFNGITVLLMFVPQPQV